ncbi:MAG: hypothetical protein ACYDAL_08625, partial [Candidatus Dormibacteraceae bacterium]
MAAELAGERGPVVAIFTIKSIDHQTFVWYSTPMLATQDVYSPSRHDLLRERLLQRRRVIDLQEIAFAREAAEFA